MTVTFHDLPANFSGTVDLDASELGGSVTVGGLAAIARIGGFALPGSSGFASFTFDNGSIVNWNLAIYSGAFSGQQFAVLSADFPQSMPTDPAFCSNPFPSLSPPDVVALLCNPVQPPGIAAADGVGFYSEGARIGPTSGYSTAPGSWKGCIPNPNDVQLFAVGPISKDGKLTTMQAEFTPHDSNGNAIGLDALAIACGFDGFAWQQQVTALPVPNPFSAVANPGVPLLAPPSFYDPPPDGGYTYAPTPVDNTYPFYNFIGDRRPVPCTGQLARQDDNTLAMQDCPADPQLPKKGFIAFETNLVGIQLVDTPIEGSIQPAVPVQVLKTWTWTSNFNGTLFNAPSGTGGVQLLSVSPVDPKSGTGGVAITSIDGVAQTPPTVSCSASSTTLWPPNGRTVPVAVSGRTTAGTSAVGTTTFLVTDSQSSSQQNGILTPQSNGAFSFTVPLVASRAGNIKSGRQYTVAVTANDAIGNQGSCSAVVTVPHDQGN
jgi:hypothetical protein